MRTIIVYWGVRMLKLVSAFKLFKKTYVSKKTPALLLLNKLLPKDSGKIVDFFLDREKNSIEIVLEQGEQQAVVTVVGYEVRLIQQQTVISWRSLRVSGDNCAALRRQLARQKSVVLPAYLFNLVNGLVGGKNAASEREAKA